MKLKPAGQSSLPSAAASAFAAAGAQTPASDPAAMTDEELMGGLRQTLDDAFVEELLRRHHAAARRFAVSRLRAEDRHLADDAVQQAFLNLVRSRGVFRPGEAFAPWFYTLLRNACADCRRREGRHRRKLLACFQETPPSPPPRTDFEQLVEPLPAADQDLLRRRFVAGHSVADLSRWLGVSLDAAKKRVQRTLRKLAGRLSLF